MGRPSSYSTELAYEIGRRLSEGESLRAICRDPAMPDKSTILRWMHNNAEFRQIYNVSRDIGMDDLADTALADATAAGMKAENVQAERLRFDARRWFVGKVAPKRWGDKVVNEHTGADGGPIALQPIPSMMVPREIAAGIKALLTKAEEAAGLPPGSGSDAERLQAVVSSGAPLHPDLYEALHHDKG